MPQTISKPITILPVDRPVIDTEYIILENIYDSSIHPLRQRDLAQIAGTSLGMTNSILKKLAQKGWISIKKLNSRNIQYAVTLEGVNEIIHRSYRYFKRTIRNVVYFKDILEDLVNRAGRKNINTVLLVGASDLDFIVEHACRRWGLRFMKIPDIEKAGKTLPHRSLIIYAEGIPEGSGRATPQVMSDSASQGAAQNSFYLSRLIIKQAARAEPAVEIQMGAASELRDSPTGNSPTGSPDGIDRH